MPTLFDPLTIRGVTIPNRIGVSPMCQYSCSDGLATDWHLVHLGSRAIGGAGLIFVEASAVEARGRISPGDMGIYKPEHVEAFARIARFMSEHGATPGIQIAHAGRKASHSVPWEGDRALTPEQGAWETVAPSPLPFRDTEPTPHALTEGEIASVIQAFADATVRAKDAGFTFLEIHAAHGYLAHEFLSPLSNQRTDGYGGSFDNRARFLLETTEAVRRVWPDDKPLAVRLSCTDWAPGGWTIEDTVSLSSHLAERGVDLIDCSSGALVPGVRIPVGPGYQVPFAEAVREKAKIATAAVGMITEPAQADAIIREGKADMVLLAREMLREPYWPMRAAAELGVKDRRRVPNQYRSAF